MDGQGAPVGPERSRIAPRQRSVRSPHQRLMHRLDAADWFPRRHIGPSPEERVEMLAAIGAASLDALVDDAIPTSIRFRTPLNLPPAESEHQYLCRLQHLAHRN